jgi:Phage tail baseplate hub (GPD)
MPQLAIDVGGTPSCDDLHGALQLIEVEENADRPDTALLRLPVSRTSSGDLLHVGDGSFDPGSNLTLTATPSGGAAQCIFDGYVLAWRLHLDRTGSASTIDVWAQDASWLMGLDDNVREWSGLTDGEVANQIFSAYGFTPADGNTDDDSPQHDPDAHTLFQRTTDLQFLRGLARRNGKLMRVACTDTPGSRIGYFVTPDVGATPAATLSLVDPNAWNVDSLEFEWDVLRPTEVDASQVDLGSSSSDGVAGNATDSGLAALGARDLPTYLGQSSTLVLTPSADVAELTLRTTAALREAEWFVRCRGETSLDRLGTLLRVGSVVTLEGAGALHSGNWLVWNVVHRIRNDHVGQSFTLVRNAIGAAPGGGPAGLL